MIVFFADNGGIKDSEWATSAPVYINIRLFAENYLAMAMTDVTISLATYPQRQMVIIFVISTYMQPFSHNSLLMGDD